MEGGSGAEEEEEEEEEEKEEERWVSTGSSVEGSAVEWVGRLGGACLSTIDVVEEE